MASTFDEMYSEANETFGGQTFLDGDWAKAADILGVDVQITGAQLGNAWDMEKQDFNREKDAAIFQFQRLDEMDKWGDEAPLYRVSFQGYVMVNFAKMLVAKQGNYLACLNGDDCQPDEFTEEGEPVVHPIFPLPACILVHDTSKTQIKKRTGNFPYKWADATDENRQREEAYLAEEAEAAARATAAARARVAAGSRTQKAGDSVNRDAQGRAAPVPTNRPTTPMNAAARAAAKNGTGSVRPAPTQKRPTVHA